MLRQSDDYPQNEKGPIFDQLAAYEALGRLLDIGAIFSSIGELDDHWLVTILPQIKGLALSRPKYWPGPITGPIWRSSYFRRNAYPKENFSLLSN
jgi:hypothetical protein